jgi:pseudouridine kinase
VRSATGAGDALLAGLVYGFVQGWPLERALAWGMGCAQITLESDSANASTLSVQAVHHQLEQAPP